MESTKLLMACWDGLDWPFLEPLLEAGKIPCLQRLIESGVAGHLSTPQPHSPAMQWTSLATGVRSDKHGVFDYVRCTEAETVPAPTDPSHLITAHLAMAGGAW